MVEHLRIGEVLLDQLVKDGFLLKVAFWGLVDEEQVSSLYLIDTEVEDRGWIPTYYKIQHSIDKHARGSLNLPGNLPLVSSVKILGLHDPIAQSVISLLKSLDESAAVEIRDHVLGNQLFEWAYLYPVAFCRERPEVPPSQGPVIQSLVDLLLRGKGEFPPSQVALRDGTSFLGVPTSLTVDVEQAGSVKFVVDSKLAPRVVSTEDIVSIR